MDRQEPKSVTIYTRGVSTVTGAGGYAVVLICGDLRKERSGACPQASNNRMDILAAVEGLRALKVPCTVTLINNNAFVTDAMAKGWVYRWRANGWVNCEGKQTPHTDLWEELINLSARHQVSFVWRRFDAVDKEYVRCNFLAHEAAGSLAGWGCGGAEPGAAADRPRE